MKWRHRCGAWRLVARGRRPRLLAVVVRDGCGWLACLPGREFAGPYDLDLARQSAERRVLRRERNG